MILYNKIAPIFTLCLEYDYDEVTVMLAALVTHKFFSKLFSSVVLMQTDQIVN